MSDVPRWEELLPTDLSQILIPVKSWTGDDPDAVIPSFRLGQDGPSLSSIFCIYGQLMCEIQIRTGEKAEFDFVRIDHLLNLRVSLDQVAVGPDDNKRTYQTADIVLHHFGEGFSSHLEYVGDARKEWLADVQRHFPVTLLTGAKLQG